MLVQVEINNISDLLFLLYPSTHPVFGTLDCLSPNDTRQYLYCLTPRPEIYSDTRLLKGVTNIGKLDIVWKTSMGERGRLQTSQLQRVVGSRLLTFSLVSSSEC